MKSETAQLFNTNDRYGVKSLIINVPIASIWNCDSESNFWHWGLRMLAAAQDLYQTDIAMIALHTNNGMIWGCDITTEYRYAEIIVIIRL